MTASAAPGGVHRRFVAPLRDAVDARVFAHPLFAGLAGFEDLLHGPCWLDVAALDARLQLPALRLVEQDAALLADGLHYEQRIAAGRLATRARNWHDLFNALVWARYPLLKRALNTRQCLHLHTHGKGARNRAQAALTQFDESGVVVRVQDERILAAWDQHAWRTVFDDSAWQEGAVSVAAVFGHALMEQALVPGHRLVGKCLVVRGGKGADVLGQVAAAINAGAVLSDPLQLRPLPLLGIPGWSDAATAVPMDDERYYRPVREGRCYPPPL